MNDETFLTELYLDSTVSILGIPAETTSTW